MANTCLYWLSWKLAYKWGKWTKPAKNKNLFMSCLKDDLQSVLRSLSTLMFQCKSPSMECKSTNLLTCLWDILILFRTVFFNFNSYKVVLSSDIKKNKAWSFASITAVHVKLWINFMYVVAKCYILWHESKHNINNYSTMRNCPLHQVGLVFISECQWRSYGR